MSVTHIDVTNSKFWHIVEKRAPSRSDSTSNVEERDLAGDGVMREYVDDLADMVSDYPHDV